MAVMTPQPTILGYCKRCARCWCYERETDYNVVSAGGIFHIGGDYGMTACGIDATGGRWWWRC